MKDCGNEGAKMADALIRDMYGLDEYDPVEALENELAARTRNCINARDVLDFDVSNDQFLTAIFGDTFGLAKPLVCKKSGDPDASGWSPICWPTDTSNEDQNWYAMPSLYMPEESGRYRARKQLAISVHAMMIDDVGTKVAADRFAECPPSWAIETSPNNFQYGYLFSNPVTDLNAADRLKEKLIEAGLCDSGATGGTTRWMRLPVGINGRPRYGSPPHKCRLTQWRPELRYTVEELYVRLQLKLPPSNVDSLAAKPNANVKFTDISQCDNAAAVVASLKEKGLYKNDLGSGKHDITCPWAKEHTDAIDNGSAYFEPSPKYPTGGFRCHHSHGNLFHIRELKEFLGIGAASGAAAHVAQPQKLPPALRPVPLLDTRHLPVVLRDAVVDLAERLHCPPDYLAVAMLCAAGSVVGNKIGIFPYANDESWQVYPAVWGGIVGDPGSKKTPSLQQAHAPLHHLESRAAQRHAADMLNFEQAKAQHEQAMKAWSTAKGSAPKPLAPTEPKRERYIVHDSTYQALGVILADNPRGVLALADELSGLLQSLDTAGQEAARGFYLTGWSGTGSYSFDRIGRGSITLSRYCLSVFGGFQPDRIRAYVQFAQRGNSRNDGLLQRFQLIVWPDPLGTVTLVDRAPNHAAMNRYQQAVLNLPNLDQTQLQGAQRLANGSQLLHFSSTAQQIFYEWYVENERLLAIGGLDSARQSHFAKYRSLVPALALLFHLLDGETDGVCDDCLTRAIGFTEYLKKHANRIYASVSGHDHAATRTLATRLLDGQLSDGFTCRTLALKGWSGLATKEQAQAAIDALVDFDWLFEEEIRSGGRPTVRYTLNPSVTSDLL
jgi:hypothetical protein